MAKDAQLERRIAALERRVAVGMMASTTMGKTEIRPFQTGAPAVLTGRFNATPGPTAGYPWQKLALSNSTPGIVASPVPETGYNAYTPGNDTSLQAGQYGWLEYDRQGSGYEFIPTFSTSQWFRPVQITEVFNNTTGYSWELLALNTSNAMYAPASPAVTGNQLVMVDNNQKLQVGRDLIMFPDPVNPGWWMGELWPLPIVANVCDTVVSGVVTGIEVEYYNADGTTYCDDDPNECCNTCMDSACPSGIPETTYLTFSGFTNITSKSGKTFHLSDFNSFLFEVQDGTTNIVGQMGNIILSGNPSNVYYAQSYGSNPFTPPYNPLCSNGSGLAINCAWFDISCPENISEATCIGINIYNGVYFYDFAVTIATPNPLNACNPSVSSIGASINVSSCDPFCASGSASLEVRTNSATIGVTNVYTTKGTISLQGPSGCISSEGRMSVEANETLKEKQLRAAAKPLSFPLCLYRGQETTPPDGKPTAKTWTGCNHPSQPLGPKVCTCEGCGPSCRGYSALEPDKIVQLDPSKLIATDDKRAFNCSIVGHGGKRIMAYRAGWFGSKIYTVELNGNEIASEKKLLNLAHPKAHGGTEDPRWFTFQGKLKLAFCGLSYLPNKPLRASVMVADLGDDLQVQRVWEPNYPARNQIEKSWSFFESEGELFCIYTHNPLRILKIDPEACTAKDFHETRWMPIWSGGQIRGGASPVRVGDEFYSFFHGRKRADRGKQEWYDYSVGCLVLSASPPFKPLRMTPGPIWLPDDNKTCLNFTPDKTVIYPGSAILSKGSWEIAAGHQDTECLVGTIDADELESKMVKV